MKRLAGLSPIVLTVATMLLSGCVTDSDDRYGSPPSRTTAPSLTPSAAGVSQNGIAPVERDKIRAQYRRFWSEVLPEAYNSDSSRRRAILEPYVVDPALSKLLQNMASQDAAGQRAYGVDIPISETIEKVNDLSLVRGCLDSSKSGIRDAATGKKLNRGPERNPVLVNLRRSSEDVWRVSFIKFPGGRVC